MAYIVYIAHYVSLPITPDNHAIIEIKIEKHTSEEKINQESDGHCSSWSKKWKSLVTPQGVKKVGFTKEDILKNRVVQYTDLGRVS